MRRRAILCVLASSGSFALAAGLVKAAAPEIPVMELALFRSGVAVLFMLPLIIRQGGWLVLKTRRPLGHLMRGVAGLTGMVGSYYGYAHLPLAAVTALGFAMPIFLAMLSVPLLRERVTPARAVSIVAGLLGVLLVIRPWEGAGGLPLYETSVVVVGVAAWALGMVSIRRMGQAGERNLTIVVLFSLFATVAAGVMVVPVWVTPRLALWPVLIGVGLVSGMAQLLMTEGYRSGEASMLAPFEYSAIFYTVGLGWLVWGEVPGVWEASGIAVLVAAGLFTWWRETRAG
jgi:drug/metabolite transporter (DMT)-like permease